MDSWKGNEHGSAGARLSKSMDCENSAGSTGLPAVGDGVGAFANGEETILDKVLNETSSIKQGHFLSTKAEEKKTIHSNLEITSSKSPDSYEVLKSNEFFNTSTSSAGNHTSDTLGGDVNIVIINDLPSASTSASYQVEEILSHANDCGGVKENNLEPMEPDSESSTVISNQCAIYDVEDAIETNNSLSLLKDYESEDDDEPVVILDYREEKNEEDSDSDSSSSSSSTSKIISDLSESESEEEDEYDICTPSPAKKPIKAKGELSLEDLPPIEDLKISVPEEDCVPIGKVYQIVDQLVVVEATKGTPAYDLDTVLFLQGGEPLGKIFDVFGPVAEPYYCVRFNSNDQIKEKAITLNQTVYSAPKTKYTNYVFLAQLLKLKGSDASWKNDIEPPEVFLDYSDDEQEQLARKKKCRSGKAPLPTESDADEPARKRHSAYEKRMNARNLQLTAARNQQPFNGNRGLQAFNTAFRKTANSLMGSSVVNRNAPPSYRDIYSQRFGGPPVFNNRAPSPAMQFRGPWSSTLFTDSPRVIRNPQPFTPWRPMNFSSPGPSSTSSVHSYPFSPNSPRLADPWLMTSPPPSSPLWPPVAPLACNNNHQTAQSNTFRPPQPAALLACNNNHQTAQSNTFRPQQPVASLACNTNHQTAQRNMFRPPQPLWLQSMMHSNSLKNFNPTIPPPSPPRLTAHIHNFGSPPLPPAQPSRPAPFQPRSFSFNPTVPPPPPQMHKY